MHFALGGARVETYTLDNQPPVLSGVAFDGGAVPAVLTTSGTFSIMASDPSGVARVEFRLGAQLLGIDDVAADGFSVPFSVENAPDGNQRLTVQAWDRFGLASAPLSVPVEVEMPPPPPPTLTSPTDGWKQNRPEVITRGHAQPGCSIAVSRGGSVIGAGMADAAGVFAIPVDLVSGENAFTATASNRNPLPSAASAAVVVTYDNTVPSPAQLPVARARAAGRIDLSWQAESKGTRRDN